MKTYWNINFRLIALMALVYFIAGKLSFLVQSENEIVTIVLFAAEGFALAGVLLFGKRVIPGIFLGQLILSLSTGLEITPSIFVSIVNSLEAFLALYLFNRLKLDRSLSAMKDIAGLTLLIVFILQPFSAIIGNSILYLSSAMTIEQYPKSVFSWWFGNSMGQLLIAPFLLYLYSRYRDTKKIEFIGVGTIFLALTYFLIIYIELPYLALLFCISIPLLILLIIKRGMHYAMFSTVAMSIVATYSVYINIGLFSSNETIENIINLNFYILSHALFVFIIGTLFSEKQEAMVNMQISEEKFKTLFNIAPIFINSFDKEGRVSLWNKECERAFGWSFEELKKIEDPLNLFYPHMSKEESLYKIVSNKKSNIFAEWHPRTKSGDTLITRWANIALSNNELIHIGYDVTKERQISLEMEEKTELLKKTTQQLEELNRDLESKIQIEVARNAKIQLLLLERNKLAQMGEMIENIAHQWRQPLSEINSLVLLLDNNLEKKGLSDEIVNKQLSSIEDLTYHMSKTIDNFKNFFNPEKKQEIFSLLQIVHNTLKITKGSFENNYINIIVDVDETFLCNGYPSELQEVILIILNNAQDALVEHNIKNPTIELKAIVEEENYILSVCDNAHGIADDILDKIFAPYFSTKHKKQGTGIGLYMARTIVEERLKGKIEVKNTPAGACFRVYFTKGEVGE